MKIVPVLLLMFATVGCLDRVHAVAHYQQKATADCLKNHTPEECHPLPYPSETK